jgi:hypothetical protein
MKGVAELLAGYKRQKAGVAQCILWILVKLNKNKDLAIQGRAWATGGGYISICNPGIFLLFFTLSRINLLVFQYLMA